MMVINVVKESFFSALICLLFLGGTVPAGAAEYPAAGNYNGTLPRSAFQASDVRGAVLVLVDENVPITEIIQSGLRSGASHESLVGALLAAGVPEKTVITKAMQGPMSAGKALKALSTHKVPPAKVLKYLIEWESPSGTVYETCDYMLKHGYTEADLLRALSNANAERETVAQVVRWFDIPPATLVSVLQPAEPGPERFGHVFARHVLPQPAQLALGVSRVNNSDAFKNRGPVSPMKP